MAGGITACELPLIGGEKTIDAGMSGNGARRLIGDPLILPKRRLKRSHGDPGHDEASGILVTQVEPAGDAEEDDQAGGQNGKIRGFDSWHFTHFSLPSKIMISSTPLVILTPAGGKPRKIRNFFQECRP